MVKGDQTGSADTDSSDSRLWKPPEISLQPFQIHILDTIGRFACSDENYASLLCIIFFPNIFSIFTFTLEEISVTLPPTDENIWSSIANQF